MLFNFWMRVGMWSGGDPPSFAGGPEEILHLLRLAIIAIKGCRRHGGIINHRGERRKKRRRRKAEDLLKEGGVTSS